MGIHSFRDNISDLHPGIQGRIRILKHHLHFFSKRFLIRAFQLMHILSFIQHFSLGRIIDSYAGSPACRFSASGFPYDSQRFSLFNIERYIIDRFQRLILSHLKILL